MTVNQALEVSGVPVSRRDAEVLLGAALGCERGWLFAHGEAEVPGGAFTGFMARRAAGEPVAYIVGSKEFAGLRFGCDARALIPRPESEGLVERIVKASAAAFQQRLRSTGKPCPVDVLELGTGGGCIGLAAAVQLRQAGIPARFTLTDISPDALQLATENRAELLPEGGLQSVALVVSDLFDSVPAGRYDVIAANLPYVEEAWRTDPLAQPEVVFHEPDVALFGGNDGLDVYRRFFAGIPGYLADGGPVFLEYGELQTAAISALARTVFPERAVTVGTDYAGLDRYLDVR